MTEELKSFPLPTFIKGFTLATRRPNADETQAGNVCKIQCVLSTNADGKKIFSKVRLFVSVDWAGAMQMGNKFLFEDIADIANLINAFRAGAIKKLAESAPTREGSTVSTNNLTEFVYAFLFLLDSPKFAMDGKGRTGRTAKPTPEQIAELEALLAKAQAAPQFAATIPVISNAMATNSKEAAGTIAAFKTILK